MKLETVGRLAIWDTPHASTALWRLKRRFHRSLRQGWSLTVVLCTYATFSFCLYYSGGTYRA